MAERRTLGLADPTRVPAWTRDEIEAWATLPRRKMSIGPREKEIAEMCRRALIRLCPEAPNYAELANRLYAMPGFPRTSEWMKSVPREEAEAHIEKYVGALWHQSISEPFDGEAHANEERGSAAAPREGTDEGPR